MIKVLIQVAGGSSERRIYNECTLEYKETRSNLPPFPYPYGFVLGTRAPDGDSVDCYLITDENLQAGSIVECDPVGLLEQMEDEEVDHKILAVLPGQHAELNQELAEKFRRFISQVFVKFPDINIKVGNILPREEALHHIEAFRER